MTPSIWQVIGNSIFEMVGITFIGLSLEYKRGRLISAFIFQATYTGIALSLFLFKLSGSLALIWYLAFLLEVLFLSSSRTKDKIIGYGFLICFELPFILGIEHLTLALRLAKAEYASNYMAVAISSIYAIIFACIMSIVFLLRRRNKHKQSAQQRQRLWPFVFFPISQALLLMMLMSQRNADFHENNRFSIASLQPEAIGAVLSVLALLCLIADVILFWVMRKNAERIELQARLQMEEYQREQSAIYYEVLEKDATDMRKVRHDLNNLLQAVYLVLNDASEDKRQKVVPLIEQMQGAIENLQLEQYTHHALLNALLTNQLWRCRDMEVCLEIEIALPDPLSIADMDLCRAFSNLLDNAIRAASTAEQEQRWVRVSCFRESDYLYIRLENGKPLKLVADTKSHRGYGNAILGEIAKKYCGRFVCEDCEDTYKALLVMKVC